MSDLHGTISIISDADMAVFDSRIKACEQALQLQTASQRMRDRWTNDLAALQRIRAALTASPAGDDPKAPAAAARSSSTEAEQKVERLRGTVSFFASVIKSGEPWSGECERSLRAALAPSLPGKEEGR